MLKDLVKSWRLEDNLHKADLIVGVGIGVKKDGSAGMLSEAVAKKCAEIYKTGLAPKIVMVGGFTQNGVNEARAMGDVALLNGVRKKDVWFEESSTSTIANARNVYELIGNTGVRNVIMVSQYIHSRRVVATFSKQNHNQYEIYWASALSGYDEIPGKWQLKSEFRFLMWEYCWYGVYKLFGLA